MTRPLLATLFAAVLALSSFNAAPAQAGWRIVGGLSLLALGAAVGSAASAGPRHGHRHGHVHRRYHRPHYGYRCYRVVRPHRSVTRCRY